ncbi:hypothetical protein PRUPE_8G067400 [Prunus persica]|uniref:Uncharacterized protein n=1 Tax=Prunus persica TaxID=3760 RepID=A0A251MWK6_PRUPE|nr:hypothetical protein PRUPE_8G067400 [Prunus persica]
MQAVGTKVVDVKGFFGSMDLLRSRISSFDPHFLGVRQGFQRLGLLGAIFLPISMGSFGYSVMRIADPGGDRVLNDLGQLFWRHLVLTDFSSDSRICIKDCADKAKKTSLEGSPRAP